MIMRIDEIADFVNRCAFFPVGAIDLGIDSREKINLLTNRCAVRP